MGKLFLLSTPAKVNVAGMVVAAAGITIEYFSGVERFPMVPPGPFILVAAPALVAWAVAPDRLALLAGLPLPVLALLETTGRTSGKPRRTPLIDGLVGDLFWIVAEHGHHADYVRNLDRDPRVRVKRRRRWHSGLANVPDHDDPLARARCWLTPSGRCTEPTQPWRVCSAPTCSPSAWTLNHKPSQPNRRPTNPRGGLRRRRGLP